MLKSLLKNLLHSNFDLSKTSIPENIRIWVIWAIKKKHFNGAPENIF